MTVKHANNGSVSESKIEHISIILRNKETAKAVHDVAVFTGRKVHNDMTRSICGLQLVSDVCTGHLTSSHLSCVPASYSTGHIDQYDGLYTHTQAYRVYTKEWCGFKS